MPRFKPPRSSQALLVAVMALVAGVAGTAVAGPDATTSKRDKLTKKERKKVKKLADKRIAKAEPGLNVNSASSADTAASAANADKLDGKDAGELETSSAYVQRTSDVELTSTPAQVLATSVTTTGTRIVANAAVELDGDDVGPFHGLCAISIDGADGIQYGQVFPDALAKEATVSPTFARTVSAGTHSVTVNCVEGDGDVDAESAALSVVAVGE